MGGSHPAIETFEAIWDTGATNSVITQKVIDACSLVATGVAEVHGVNSTSLSDTYLVNIVLPNKFIVSGARVTKGDLPDAEILIGMDVINQGDFAVTNHGGKTIFSFRMPSQEHIDFVPGTNEAIKASQGNRAARRRAKKESGR